MPRQHRRMRLPELSHRQALALALAALVVAIVLGRLLTPAHQEVRALPLTVETGTEPAASAALVVDVVGAVHRPGLYRLPGGSRVNDAIVKAHGVTAAADLTLVNLAALLSDGQQVVVPAKSSAAAAAGTSSAAAPAGPVHLNSATLDQLDALPGIGPTTAQRIIDYRQQHGGFQSVDDLDAVSGIGPARLDELRGLVAP
ncbi:MAG: helix-hairpin-helix domain-containing protein [Gaiellaceae bacterium]